MAQLERKLLLSPLLKTPQPLFRKENILKKGLPKPDHINLGNSSQHDSSFGNCSYQGGDNTHASKSCIEMFTARVEQIVHSSQSRVDCDEM